MWALAWWLCMPAEGGSLRLARAGPEAILRCCLLGVIAELLEADWGLNLNLVKLDLI